MKYASEIHAFNICREFIKSLEKIEYFTANFPKDYVQQNIYKISNLICGMGVCLSHGKPFVLVNDGLFLSSQLPLNLSPSFILFSISLISVPCSSTGFQNVIGLAHSPMTLNFIETLSSVSVLPKLFYSIENHRWQNDNIGMSIKQ